MSTLGEAVARGFERIATALERIAHQGEQNTGLILEAIDGLESKVDALSRARPEPTGGPDAE